jgi:hypothetical protein
MSLMSSKRSAPHGALQRSSQDRRRTHDSRGDSACALERVCSLLSDTNLSISEITANATSRTNLFGAAVQEALRPHHGDYRAATRDM